MDNWAGNYGAWGQISSVSVSAVSAGEKGINKPKKSNQKTWRKCFEERLKEIVRWRKHNLRSVSSGVLRGQRCLSRTPNLDFLEREGNGKEGTAPNWERSFIKSKLGSIQTFKPVFWHSKTPGIRLPHLCFVILSIYRLKSPHYTTVMSS